MAFKKKTNLLNLGTHLDLVDGTPAFIEVTLPLSSLDREIFVVTDIMFQSESIPANPGINQLSEMRASVNKTDQGILFINDPNCVGSMLARVESNAVDNQVATQSAEPSQATTGSNRDFVSIIATPNFVLSGSWTTTAGGAANRGVFVRVTGFRAQADSSVYAALIAEEINAF
jgi:hypothetical protein